MIVGRMISMVSWSEQLIGNKILHLVKYSIGLKYTCIKNSKCVCVCVLAIERNITNINKKQSRP